jgi:multidrug efflux pump subunit AcrB
MISLFAFIVTLGIVVDDDIDNSEAIYKRRVDGASKAEAALQGTHDVAMPVIFSVLTTVMAFSPLLFIPGVMGKFFYQIPVVVITVLLISLVESLLILPAHLSHDNPVASFVRSILRKVLGEQMGIFGSIARQQQRFSRAVERFVERGFAPLLGRLVRVRYVAVAAGLALLMVSIGFVVGGRIDFTFMPKIQLDVVFAQLKMPYGTPIEESRAQMDRIIAAAKQVLEQNGGEDKLSRGMFSQVGGANFGGVGHDARAAQSGSHITEVAVFMVPSDARKISAQQFAQQWRGTIGDLPGADSLKFTFTAGATGSAPISFRLSHDDVPTLERAASALAAKLRTFKGVKDIDDGVALGKEQLDFRLKPEARSLGITEADLARQVRSAFFGAEASRQQRGRDEVRVYVRLPKSERRSLYDVERLLLRTPRGGEIPLSVAAAVSHGRAYTEIRRRNGHRIITVTSDVEELVTNANRVVGELQASFMPELMRTYPGLSYEMSGQQQEQNESMRSMVRGYMMALLAIFALMAIPFRSYAQPLIIMFAIPFGLVGALGGHLLMGYDLSMLSAMGFVALSGVVINDSLVLIAATNDFRRQGMSTRDAVIAGAARRFRPIVLTSLTTFFGLVPMIIETSMQARFLIPMALSLGFGVLFATFVILLLVPCVYLILDDCVSGFRRATGTYAEDDASLEVTHVAAE